MGLPPRIHHRSPMGVKSEDNMKHSQYLISRRGFCLCCVGGASFAATGGWLTPRDAFAEARGLVSLIKGFGRGLADHHSPVAQQH